MIELSNTMQGNIVLVAFMIIFPIVFFKTFGKSPEQRAQERKTK
jgi:hypothetical protein